MLELIQRYSAVIRLLGKDKNKNLQILDIGGGAESIAPYTDRKFSITSCDVEFTGTPAQDVKCVKCSGHKLPFAERSFDYVISVDALEHIPRELRKLVIEEMKRVARKQVILACPCGRFAEIGERLMIWLAKTIGKQLKWLEEHKKQGLPRKKEIKAMFQMPVNVSSNSNILAWTGMHITDFLTKERQDKLGKKEMMIKYGGWSFLLDFMPSYRKIFVFNID